MTTQNKNVPALRFPEFGDQWNETSLNKFLIPTLREIDKPTEPYLAIGVRSHCKGTFQKPDSEPEKIAMDKLFVVKENDLIVNITFAWEGAIAIVKKDDEGGLVSHRFPTYIFDDNVSSHKFFQFVFTQKGFRTNLDLISPGGAGRNRVLSKKDFLKIKVNLPELPEQQKIAAFLTAVDEKIQQLTKKKYLLEQYKKGVMQQIFNRDIRFKDDNGNVFADWEEKKLKEIGKFNSGTGFTENAQGGKDGIPFYKVSDMNLEGNEFEMKVSNNYVSAEQIRIYKYKPIVKPSIIFAKVGAAIFLERKRIAKDFLIDNNMMSFTPNDNLLFIKYVFETLKLSRFAQVGALPSYNSSDIGIIKIKLPSKPEQKKIADFLSAIDDKINLVNQQLEKTQTYKKSLLQVMFV